MAIVFDSASENTGTSNTTSISFSHNVVSDSEGCVVVNASSDNTGQIYSTTNSTFNGTAMNKLGQQASGGGAGDHEEALFTLAIDGEGTGNKTIVIEIDSSEDLYATAQTYTGVDQSTPADNFQSDGGDDGTVPSITFVSTIGDLIAGFCVMQSDDLSGVGGGQTERTNMQSSEIVSGNVELRSSDEPAGVLVTHSYPRDTTDTLQWTILGCNLNQASVTTLQINVNDSITITENVTVVIETRIVNVSDSITITENVDMSMISFVDLADNITITELAQNALISNISVSDLISITENINRRLIAILSVTDALTVTEQVSIFRNPLLLSTNDIITITESTSFASENFLSVNDEVALLDTPLFTFVVQVDVQDILQITESTDFEIPVNLSIGDDIDITESTDMDIVVNVDVFTGVDINDNIIVDLLVDIDIDDSVDINENLIVQGVTEILISIVENMDLTELVNIQVPSGLVFKEKIHPYSPTHNTRKKLFN